MQDDSEKLGTLPDPTRRRALGLVSLGLVLAGCGGSGGGDSASSVAASSSEATDSSTAEDTSGTEDTTGDDVIENDGSCTLIPQETEGPYPLSAVLSNTAIVRSDITEDRTGVPLTVRLRLVDVSNGCQPITTSASVYIWHCDKDGVYSGYSQPGANTVGETFLRGVQDVDGNGEVTFTTIYPGWYSGRITHVHFQVFLYSQSTATATSQIAFPLAVTESVYNSALYTRGQNTSVTSFAADNVFSDGTTYQMAEIEGSVSEGLVATLEVGIAYS